MDSSCFVKLFVAESGSNELVDYISQIEDRTIFVSVLAALEIRSAIRRRQFLGDIEGADAEFALSSLSKEIRLVMEQPITDSVLGTAKRVIDLHGLRALDSIQLASALVARDLLLDQSPMVLIASDHKLLLAATKEGIDTWNPSTGKQERGAR